MTYNSNAVLWYKKLKFNTNYNKINNKNYFTSKHVNDFLDIYKAFQFITYKLRIYKNLFKTSIVFLKLIQTYVSFLKINAQV